MARRSRVKDLPPEVRSVVDDLIKNGVPLDDIVDKLAELNVEDAPSRSALGRYKLEVDRVGERLRRSREISRVFVERLGAVPEGHQGRMVMELMQTMVFDVLVPKDGGEAPDFDPKDIMFLAGAIKDLASAEKISADREIKIRDQAAKQARQDAATAAEETAAERGLTHDTVQAIRRSILGIAK